MDKKKLAIAVVAAALISGVASASDKTDAIEVVHKWVEAFNKTDSAAGPALCTADAVVVDDFAPHVWQGSGACSAYFKDVKAYEERSELTGGTVTLGKVSTSFVTDGKTAYFVTPATFSGIEKGKPIAEKAIATFAFKKSSSGGWQLSGMAWADL